VNLIALVTFPTAPTVPGPADKVVALPMSLRRYG
jgi:hypothetical protein